MKEMLNSLYSELTKLKAITNFYEYYDYIKINTTCPIKYCDEYLVLYAKIINNQILITDLNGIFEDAVLNNISFETIKNDVYKNNLSCDENSIFVLSQPEDIDENIQRFFSLIKKLDL